MKDRETECSPRRRESGGRREHERQSSKTKFRGYIILTAAGAILVDQTDLRAVVESHLVGGGEMRAKNRFRVSRCSLQSTSRDPVMICAPGEVTVHQPRK